MTAMVVLDNLPLDLNEELKLSTRTYGYLPDRAYKRIELLNAMLVRSDNKAAETLAENYPGGREFFIQSMNMKAKSLGMSQTIFHDASGLSVFNVSSAGDVHKMLLAASNYALIKDISTKKQVMFETKYKRKIRSVALHNTNSRMLFEFSNIVVTKTGFTNPAGFCLGLVVEQNGKTYTVVIMGAKNPFIRLSLARSLLLGPIKYNQVLDTDLN
jgi:D-alanyl-D-alanine endopeptidase (penicillin-binding protein 7)